MCVLYCVRSSTSRSNVHCQFLLFTGSLDCHCCSCNHSSTFGTLFQPTESLKMDVTQRPLKCGSATQFLSISHLCLERDFYMKIKTRHDLLSVCCLVMDLFHQWYNLQAYMASFITTKYVRLQFTNPPKIRTRTSFTWFDLRFLSELWSCETTAMCMTSICQTGVCNGIEFNTL